MNDISAEVAALKAQLAALTTAATSAGVKLEARSIFVVYNPRKQARWCSKIDCPALGRKTSYDVVREVDGEAESIIQTGVSEEASGEGDVTRRVKRVSEPKIKFDDLGVLGSFTTKKKAIDFADTYFRLNQNNLSGDDDYELSISEVMISS